MDYDRARTMGLFEGLVSVLTGRRDALVSLAEAKASLGCYAQHYLGLQEVRVRDIIGSVSRAGDFTRTFRPAAIHTRDRWESINRAAAQGRTLPPVSLYKMGDFYFVKDGHHRISVARYRGAEYIDAEVTECVPMPHDPPGSGLPATTCS